MEPQVVRPRSPRARSARPDLARSARVDPQPRHVDGMREGRLTGDGYRPKDFHYVWVHKAALSKGVEYYEMLGYKCVAPDDGVQVTGRRQRARDGEVEMLGHVLMCLPRAEYEQIVQYGPGGDTGLANSAKIEKLIVKGMALGRDSLRGLGVRPEHIRIRNVTDEEATGGETVDEVSDEEES